MRRIALFSAQTFWMLLCQMLNRQIQCLFAFITIGTMSFRQRLAQKRKEMKNVRISVEHKNSPRFSSVRRNYCRIEWHCIIIWQPCWLELNAIMNRRYANVWWFLLHNLCCFMRRIYIKKEEDFERAIIFTTQMIFYLHKSSPSSHVNRELW